MTSKWRYNILLVSFFLILTGMIGRLAYLHVFEQTFLQRQGDARSNRTIASKEARGAILDRNGEPLAVSTEVKTIWVDPKKFTATQKQLTKLLKILELEKTSVIKKLYSARNKSFLYLKRQVIPQVAKQVLALNIPGVYVKSEYKRYYPAGDVSSHIVGITDVDECGIAGLELAYNEFLIGKVARKKVIKDLLGRTIKLSKDEKDSNKNINNRAITLSIDQRLQYIAFRELQKAVNTHQAISGSAVVLHVPTGEVLAMVNQPTFNPNMRLQETNEINNYRNQAVTDYFEPGSSIKAFSIASVLENGKNITANTLIDTYPGYIPLKGGIVKDPTNYGVINVSTLLQRSSNVGISKLVLNLPEDSLIDTYERFGFGFTTGSNFPGESSGTLVDPGLDRPFMKATMAFGYGVGVTALQLARAYAILGAGGIRKPVSFIKVNDDVDVPGERVISSNVARNVIDLLKVSIEQGKSKAKIPGYHIAGKTGTTRKLNKNRQYQEGKHRSIFAGLVPAINPKFAIVVIVNEPNSGEYYGNVVAAPVFAKVAAGAIRLFNVAPDILETQGIYLAQHGNNNL